MKLPDTRRVLLPVLLISLSALIIGVIAFGMRPTPAPVQAQGAPSSLGLSVSRDTGNGNISASWNQYAGGDFMHYQVIICFTEEQLGHSGCGTNDKASRRIEDIKTTSHSFTGTNATKSYNLALQLWVNDPRDGIKSVKQFATLAAVHTPPTPIPTSTPSDTPTPIPTPTPSDTPHADSNTDAGAR